LIAAYDESEALIKFLAGYQFVRQSNAMKDYETICETMATERERVEQMSAVELTRQSNNWPYVKNLNRMTKLSQSIRNDEKFQLVMQKVERAFQSGQVSRSSSSANEVNSREVIASPAYITPTCNFDDPSNYPSGVDLGIANGIAIALHIAVEAQPAEFMIFCVLIPNPFRIAFAIAAGVVDQVANALKAVATDGAYCESIRLFIEEGLTPDGGQIAILMNDNFYLTFMLKSVRAALSKATSTGVPTNCGSQRLTDASAFFDGSDNFTGTGPQRVDAFKKLRSAYHNIGASACVD
jgi:hypothetical protein